MDRSPLFDLAIQIGRIHAEQYIPVTRIPSPSALQADADRADRVVGLIEKAQDRIQEAIAHLEQAATLSGDSDCTTAAEELRVILKDNIRGDALFTARETANTAQIAVLDAYHNPEWTQRSAAE